MVTHSNSSRDKGFPPSTVTGNMTDKVCQTLQQAPNSSCNGRRLVSHRVVSPTRTKTAESIAQFSLMLNF